MRPAEIAVGQALMQAVSGIGILCGPVIVGQIAHGATFEEVLEGYPDLERTDIQQAVAYAAWLTWQLMQKMGSYQMTVVNLPMNLVYGVVLLAFLLMLWRAAWVMRRHWQRGFSVLERPDHL